MFVEFALARTLTTHSIHNDIAGIIVKGPQLLLTYPAALEKSQVLNKRLQEAPDAAIDLSMFEADPVKEVIRFLNTSKVIKIDAVGDAQADQLDLLIKTYIFAYYFEIESLQDALVDEMLLYLAKYWCGSSYLDMLEAALLADTPMVRLLVAQLAREVKSREVLYPEEGPVAGFEDWITEGGPVVYRFVVALAQKEQTHPRDERKGFWHVHTDGSKCACLEKTNGTGKDTDDSGEATIGSGGDVEEESE